MSCLQNEEILETLFEEVQSLFLLMKRNKLKLLTKDLRIWHNEY